MNESDELFDIMDDLGASARTHELFQENKIGIDEVAFLNPDQLIRYEIHTEGDQILPAWDYVWDCTAMLMHPLTSWTDCQN